jgi:hypothetical protein
VITIAPTSQFLALAKEFAQLLQVPFEESQDLFGLEFETEQFIVRVLPHPQDDHQFLVAVDVLSIEPQASACALSMLLGLNRSTMVDHGWGVGLEEGDKLVLFRSVAFATTDASHLENLIIDGLERAGALSKMWKIASKLPDAPSETTDFSTVFLKA